MTLSKVIQAPISGLPLLLLHFGISLSKARSTPLASWERCSLQYLFQAKAPFLEKKRYQMVPFVTFRYYLNKPPLHIASIAQTRCRCMYFKLYQSCQILMTEWTLN